MGSSNQFDGFGCAALRAVAFSCGMLVLGVGTPAQGAQAASKAEAVLAKCASDGKYAFVFFYRQGASAPGKMSVTANTSQTQQLRAVFDAAMEKVSAKALPVLVNVADASETAVVQRFRVSRTPMPWVMAVAPNGAITRGLARFTERDLLGAFVSPGLEKVLKAFQTKRPVLLCVQNAKTSSNEMAMKGVTDFLADPQVGKAADILTVDPSDKAESDLLRRFKIDANTTEALTVLLAPPGTVLASYRGATSKDALVAKVKASAAACGSGCGSGGCKPAKKAPVWKNPTIKVQ